MSRRKHANAHIHHHHWLKREIKQKFSQEPDRESSKLMDFKFVKKLKPYFAVLFVQFGIAGFSIVAKFALNQGMSHYTLAVYRNGIAAAVVAPFALFLERKIRPRMTLSILSKIMLLGLLEPVMDQNLLYAGMKYTSASYTAAMCNVLPAMTFILAWALRVERVNVRRIRSQAKIAGTLTTVGGAMIMTLVNGSVIDLPWTEPKPNSQSTDAVAHQNPLKGALMIAAGCFCWSLFYILQAHVLKSSYPAGLSLTSLLCAAGASQGALLTLLVERGNTAIWSLGWDAKLLAYVYGGVVCSGLGFYVSGVIMEERGPVFVTSFSPLSMVIVAVLSSFILSEQLDVGKITGAMVIVIGLYLVVWGRAKDHVNASHAQSETINEQGSDTNPPSKNPDVSQTTTGDNVVCEQV